MTKSQSTQAPFLALSAPVGHLMRPAQWADAQDSLGVAIDEFRRNGGGLLPVVSEGILVGVLTEAILAESLGSGANLNDACVAFISEPFTIAPYASGAEALRLLSEMDLMTLVVVDDNYRVVGLISPSDLYPRRRELQRPSPVGGMATPFGVYLTSGGLHGGVSLYAVMATGAAMFSMFTVSIILVSLALSPLSHTRLTNDAQIAIIQGVSLLGFLAIMRLVPLSGTHGAEHMVVHAMERGEDLTPEIVARMPRVHPRCGTNLAAAAFLFLGVFSLPVLDDSSRFIIAALLTMFLWKPVGSFTQQYITTRKPTDRQLRSGIKAGTELIEKYSTARHSTASIPKRIWNSGLLHVMTGSGLAFLVVKGITLLFHFNLPGLD